MSYCRWSAECDVYSYNCSDGYITELINGEEFFDKSLPELRCRLLQLKEQGYQVPEHVILQVQDDYMCGTYFVDGKGK